MDVPIYLDINECLVNNNGCQQNCYNFLGSAICWCKSGYSLASDQRSCNDVDECSGDSNKCDQTCTNTEGSYTCSCNSGYTLSSDGRSCNDVDECSSSSTNDCDHVCTNTEGSYTCSCNSGYTLGDDGQSCNQPDDGCGGTLTASSGSFHSPGYPNGYPVEDFKCEWIIEGSVGSRIEFIVDDTQYGINGRDPCTEFNEHIEFFDGTGNNANSLRKLCGRPHFYADFDSIRHITTSSSQARVVFTSNDRPRSASRVGVKVDYTIRDINECSEGTHNCDQVCTNTDRSYTCSCNSRYTLAADGRSCTANPVPLCGGQLTASSGSFHSPGYPDGYPQDDFECEWTIEVATGLRIEFTIDDSPFGINDRPPCNTFNDHIEFFDGTGNNANSLRKLCGKAKFYSDFDSLRRVNTTSSQAKVVFTGSVNRKRPASRVGVRVTYRTV